MTKKITKTAQKYKSKPAAKAKSKTKSPAKASGYKEYTVKVYDNGNKYWYLNGKLHRADGPAIEYANGDKEWCLNGECHREDGPAVEYANGDKEWYLDGKEYTEAEFNVFTNKNNCEGKCVEIDGVKYKLTVV